MNRIDRLFAITLMLQSQKRVRAKDIAERFEISERTVYRDINALGELGIPVVALPGEGYELMAGFTMPPIVLSADEATALFLAARMFMQQAQGHIKRDTELALQKIRATLPEDSQVQAETLSERIDFYPADDLLNFEDPRVVDLREAILKRWVVQIDYHSRKDETTQRDIEPEQLTFANGAWYLHAYCRLRQDEREFRLSRIVHMKVKDETFEPRMIISAKPQMIEVRVRFDEDMLRWVAERQHYGFFDTEYDKFDNTIFVYQVSSLEDIQSWIFGWGAKAEVLSPLVLREKIRKEAQALINKLT